MKSILKQILESDPNNWYPNEYETGYEHVEKNLNITSRWPKVWIRTCRKFGISKEQDISPFSYEFSLIEAIILWLFFFPRIKSSMKAVRETNKYKNLDL